MMKKKSSILGRSESVRAPVSYYGERDAYPHPNSYQQQQQLLRGRLHHGQTDQVDYMSEDGLARHVVQNGNGASASANKRVSFNRDVAVKRIPSVLHHNRPSTVTTSTPTTPAAVVVVFPSNNSATVSQINGRRGANLGSLPPDQQQMLLREARNVLEQMESISCQVSRDSQPPPQQQWRYSSSPSPPPSPVLMSRRRVVHPPPVSQPLKRSESLAGIFYSTRHQEPAFARDQASPRRLLNSNSNSQLNLNSHAAPTSQRVVKKRSPSVRTPLFPQKSNNSLGESSGSGSSGETSGPTMKPRSGSGSGIMPPSLWPESFSYSSGHSTSTPSPISSLSSASSAGSATKQYFFGQDPALHSDLNENVIFKQPQSLKIFQNHHNRGLGIGTPTTKPTGFMSEEELNTSVNRKRVVPSAPKMTTLAGIGTLERKKHEGSADTMEKPAAVPDPPPPPPLPPKGGTKIATVAPAVKKSSNVTTVVVNSNSSSSSSSECGVSLAGEDADDDEEEEQVNKYPLILRATSALDTQPPTPVAASVHKPFFYGDRLPTDAPTAKAEHRARWVDENQAPFVPANGINLKSAKPVKESSGSGFMSTLLRRKSAKISIKPEPEKIASSPKVLQLGTEQRLQQKLRDEQSEAAPAIMAKRPTRIKSFLALFMGRGSSEQESKKKHFSKGNSISTPSLEKWSKAADEGEYRPNYKSNNHYY